MTRIGEFRVPATEFLLRDAIAATDGVVTVERMVVDGHQAVTPYVWAGSVNFEAFEAALRADASVREFEVVERHDNECLYRTEWRDGRNELVAALDEVAATVLSAESEGGVWILRVLFSDEKAVSTFEDQFLTDHRGVELERLYRSDDPSTYGKYEVTDKQREALTLAREAGYFSVPRECSLQDIADQLGISRNAASARLRRGQAALVSHTLDHEGHPTG